METPPVRDHAVWDWDDLLLDFDLDDQDQNAFPPPPPSDPAPLGQVRKRNPMLTCSNFLAGMVPCACPELDQLLAEEEEEEEGLPGKKRVRVASGRAHCQVPGCLVDISELKGSHKRHRVCLGCAIAVSVLLDGETKRYCGKFHVLQDFDEDRRSCRRKLQRHNNRRRRKPQVSMAAVDREAPRDFQTDNTTFHAEIGTGGSSQMVAVNEVFVESEDGHVSARS